MSIRKAERGKRCKADEEKLTLQKNEKEERKRKETKNKIK